MRAIMKYPEARALDLERKRLPLLGWHLRVRAGKLLTLTSFNLIEPDVVFRRIGACHVVVVLVPAAGDKSCGLVNRPGDRFKADRRRHICGRKPVIDTEGEANRCLIGACLCQHFPTAWRREVLDDHPGSCPPPPVAALEKPVGSVPTTLASKSSWVAALSHRETTSDVIEPRGF